MNRKHTNRYRPTLEILENRCLPSGVSASLGNSISLLGDDYVTGKPGQTVQASSEAYAAIYDDSIASLLDPMDATTTQVSLNGGPEDGSQPPFFIQIDSEFMRVVNMRVGVWTVERGANASLPQPHAAWAPIYLADISQLSARMEILPNVPGRDVITTSNGVTGLVLVSKPEASPSDQGENSKVVTLFVKNWRSNTSDRVEVLIMDGTGVGRVLLPFQIPNNLPNKLRVDPAEGHVANVISSADANNMHNTAASDNQEYGFPLGFSVLRGATPGITPVTLIVRQGHVETHIRLDLVVQVPGLTPPSPISPIGTANTVAPTFNWTAVPNAARYEVWVADASNTRVLYTNGATDTKWTANAFLTAGNSYTWWVRAIASDGTASPWSVGQTFTVTSSSATTAPAAPASLSWQPVSGNNINLTWSGVAGADGYKIYYWNGTAWTEIANVGANTTSLYVTNGYGYYYLVGAYNTAGANYSSYILAQGQSGGGQTSAPAAPNQPVWSPVSGNDINLSWNDVTGETGYVIEYWNGSDWVQFANVDANVTSLYVTSGFGYYFRVGAANSIGTSYSDYVFAE